MNQEIRIRRLYRQTLIICASACMGLIVFGPVLNKALPALVCLAIAVADLVYYMIKMETE